jgi:hypothetical protein
MFLFPSNDVFNVGKDRLFNLFGNLLVCTLFMDRGKSWVNAKFRVSGECPENGAISPETDELLGTQALVISVFRTGSGRHSEPIACARREFKALVFQCQGF